MNSLPDENAKIGSIVRRKWGMGGASSTVVLVGLLYDKQEHQSAQGNNKQYNE